jgi:glycosyltransferase involved in cell wall biosynthesis
MKIGKDTPRLLHQVWVGPDPAPWEWIQTWKDKHPAWEHKLWTENDIIDFDLQRLIEYCLDQGLYHGVADLVRYEVLYKHGGFFAPGDAECLNPIDELLDIEEDCFACYQHEKKRPGLISPHLATTKGNALMGIMVERLKGKKIVTEPWIETGNQFLTEVVNEIKYPIKIYPSRYFIPKYNDGSENEGDGKVYADQKWYTTKKIMESNEGGVEFLEDRVRKTYKKKSRESYFLKKYKSPYFVELLDDGDNWTETELLGEPVGNEWIMDVEKDKFIKWLEGLRKELKRLKIRHRDIYPKNILHAGDSYKLIDFSLALEEGEPEPNQDLHERDDDKCIDKIIEMLNRKVTLITTAFNGYGKYIPEFVENAKDQKEPADEIIIVLGKDHGLKEYPEGVKIIETELTCLGSLVNEGIKQATSDWVLCFNVDDILFQNAVQEIKRIVNADIITLTYFLGDEICDTPKITRDRIRNWKDYYMGASGYLAFRKQLVEETDFWQYPLLFKNADKKIVKTEVPCAEWIQRPDSHGSGKNVQKGIEEIDKYAKKYTHTLSVFSIVKDEEEMCREAWESVKDADELVICIDDRTTDKTPEIAKEYTDKIYYFKWEDDFAKAKNFAMSKCSKDWVMGIDADCTLEDIKKVYRAIDKTRLDMADVTLYARGMEWHKHQLPKVFRNGKIKYEGRAHEHPVGGKRDFTDYGIRIEYDYSPNHKKDPDRYIRILNKSIKEEPNNPRWKYYLSREYYYRQDFKEAIKRFQEYTACSTFLAEKADAYLYLARAYWKTNQGEEARNCCLKAIQINPNFKEALYFMSQIVWRRHSQRWQDYANLADNSEVLFIR